MFVSSVAEQPRGGRGRYYTDKSGSTQMLAAGRSHPDPAWAAEGGNGGKHIAHLLVHDEELWWTCS